LGDVTTPEFISPGSPAANVAQGSGESLATDASSAATSSSLSTSVTAGQTEVPPERASVAAEADSTTSPITNFRETISEKLSGVNGDDRTPPSLAAESSDDSSIESSTVSRRISSKSLSQLSVAELDDLRQQLLSLPTASAPPIVGVGAHGGSLAARADVGAVPAAVTTQPSGSSIIPEVPVHPLGNGASGGQLLSQPSRTAFDVELDSLLASDPSIPCPPEARAALIRLKSHDHNGLELLEPVPAASSSRKNVVVTYAVSDQEVVKTINQGGVILGDSMGEMSFYYALSDIVIMGGSLLPLGGQNFIEACALGRPIILGEHTFNFQQASTDVIDSRAAIRITDVADLVKAMDLLLTNHQIKEEMSTNALDFANQHTGATKKIVAVIQQTLQA
jgi:hypothetical protein